MKILLTYALLLVSTLSFSAMEKNDTLNRLDAKGRRTGWWIFDKENNPVSDSKAEKSKEGRFIKGRKYGAWINYYEDGKTPRLIGEYSDNRPAGSFVRFNKQGKITQAGAVPRKIPVSQFLLSKNSVFSCKLLFVNKETVAGQVFFTSNIFMKGYATRFWMGSVINEETTKASEVNFDWLNENYKELMISYLEDRNPVTERLKLNEEIVSAEKPKKKEAPVSKNLPYFRPPVVSDPIVAPGASFKQNGLNKVFTRESEIWMDGYFKNGRLESGKVFVYDRDGILLKVRVYKEGVYYSDGVL